MDSCSWSKDVPEALYFKSLNLWPDGRSWNSPNRDGSHQWRCSSLSAVTVWCTRTPGSAETHLWADWTILQSDPVCFCPSEADYKTMAPKEVMKQNGKITWSWFFHCWSATVSCGRENVGVPSSTQFHSLPQNSMQSQKQTQLLLCSKCSKC